MKFRLKNGYALVELDRVEGCVHLENIKVYEKRKGTGKKLLDKVKKYANEKGLPIVLYAYPQDDSISDEGLRAFYLSNGFKLHPDDCDNSLFIY